MSKYAGHLAIEAQAESQAIGRPLRDLRIIRAVSGLSISGAYADVQQDVPHPSIKIYTTGKRNFPRIGLLVRQDMVGVPTEPFVPADEIMADVLEQVPSLHEPRTVTIDQITTRRSKAGDGYVRLMLVKSDLNENRRERRQVNKVVHSLAEQRFGYTHEWPTTSIQSITLAFVPRSLPADMLPATCKLINYALDRTVVLDPVHPNPYDLA